MPEMVIEVSPGLSMCFDTAFFDHDEDLIVDKVRQCMVPLMKREAVLARVKQCVEQLDIDGLAVVSEAVGWTSNYRTHTVDDYRRAMLALVGTIQGDCDLLDVLDVCEHYMRKVTAEGEVQP